MAASTVCELCDGLEVKTARAKPHDQMLPMEEKRVFGRGHRGYVEQDYRCVECGARFTFSTDKNNKPWTLWRG